MTKVSVSPKKRPRLTPGFPDLERFDSDIFAQRRFLKVLLFSKILLFRLKKLAHGIQYTI